MGGLTILTHVYFYYKWLGNHYNICHVTQYLDFYSK